MIHPKVAIIILNWNGWGDTRECLESLYQITYPNYDVIVVDNGSEDESIEKIKEYCEGEIEVESKFFEYSGENKPIKIIGYTREEAEAGGGKEGGIADLPSNGKMILIKNEENYGFAEGNNIGMRYALKALNPDYVLLLNNDTVVDKEFLGELVRVGEDERAGIMGPKIYYYDYSGRSDVIWFAGGKIRWWTGYGHHNGQREIDRGQYDIVLEPSYITGCAMLIRREVLEECGMFDSKFFLYYEDTDLCFRIKRLDWRVKYMPTAKVWHKVSQSSAKSSFAMYYNTRNRIVFMRKNFSKFKYLIFLVIILTCMHILMGAWLILKVKSFKSLKSFYKGLWDGILNSWE